MNIKRKDRLKQGLLKTGEIAEKAGVLPSCVSYYTQLGLLEYVARTQGNYKLYKKDDTLSRLSIIRSLKEKGLNLKAIKLRVKSRGIR